MFDFICEFLAKDSESFISFVLAGFAVHSGEFTLRAFLNGRLDLSQAENVEKLISAKSSAAADAALEGIQAYTLHPL